MQILGKRILVSKIEEVAKEGFQTVKTQDEFLYKGKVEMLGSEANSFTPRIKEGDVIIFTKYSPDTHEVEHNDQVMKIIRTEDILAIL